MSMIADMNRTISNFWILSLVFFLFGCSQQAEPDRDEKPLIVFNSILPQSGLCERIAGPYAEVHTLVEEGQSPHSYEPSPKNMAKLAEADLLFGIGISFENRLFEKIRRLYPSLKITITDQNIIKRRMEHDHNHGGNCPCSAGAGDPHIWMSPSNAILIATQMKEELIAARPQYQKEFEENWALLIKELEQLDQDIAAMLAPYKGRALYVYHPAWGYFTEAYGLKQVPLEIEGKSPSPRQVGQLIEQASQDGTRFIVVQKQFPETTAKAIAQAIDGKIVRLDPLAKEYISNLREIAERIKKAFENE
jgi:zinc transport system substrate-binding protein